MTSLSFLYVECDIWLRFFAISSWQWHPYCDFILASDLIITTLCWHWPRYRDSMLTSDLISVTLCWHWPRYRDSMLTFIGLMLRVFQARISARLTFPMMSSTIKTSHWTLKVRQRLALSHVTFCQYTARCFFNGSSNYIKCNGDIIRHGAIEPISHPECSRSFKSTCRKRWEVSVI